MTLKLTKPKITKKAVGALALVAVVGVGAYFALGAKRDTATERDITYTDETVERRTISQFLSSSGTLTAANSYNVTTTVDGEVLWSGLEEGTLVEAEDLLFEIDSSDASSTLEKSEISYAQSLRSYENTMETPYITSNHTGEIYELLVDVGDTVSNGQTIANVRDNRTLDLKVPFPADDAAGFSVGQSATITLSGTFETLMGTVRKISGSTDILPGNRMVRNVTVTVENNGGLSDALTASVTIDGIGASGSGTLTYASTGSITASSAGEIVSLSMDEGDFIYKDQTLATLGGDDMADKLLSAEESLRTAQLSYENSQNALDNYTITSPIAGTLIEKNYKTGDNVEGGDSLCLIYDLSYLEMTMHIDELDIKNVAVGQTVAVVPDSNDAVTFQGEVTKVSVAGTTSGGTTTYPVTVRIAEFGDLLPGMNVSAEIVLDQVQDTISVSNSVVQRGNMVLLTADSPSAVNALEDQEAPEGYVYVAVTTGLSDDDYVEITSGLTPEDTVASMAVTMPTSEGGAMMIPGMSSGMNAGMSSGTRPSGMSGGGMRG